MPLKKLHKCNKLGCNNLTRNRYCKEHEYIELEQKRIINRTGEKAAATGVSSCMYPWEVFGKRQKRESVILWAPGRLKIRGGSGGR